MKNLTEKNVLAALPLLYVLIFVAAPTLLIIIVAFCKPGDYGGVMPAIQIIGGHLHFNLSLNSVFAVFTSHYIGEIFFRSFLFSIIVTFIALLIAYPIAFLIANVKKKFADLLLIMVIVPFWSCFLIRIYAWMIILSPKGVVAKTINYVLQLCHFHSIELLHTQFAVILCLVYINLPFMILPLYANLEKHDYLLIQASRDLGANARQAFLNITLPLSLPGIFAGCALVFVPCIGMFVVSEFVGNNDSIMVGNLIKQQFLESMQWPSGSFTAILITLAAIAAVALAVLLSKYLGVLRYVSK